jgi:hypothetical protein
MLADKTEEKPNMSSGRSISADKYQENLKTSACKHIYIKKAFVRGSVVDKNMFRRSVALSSGRKEIREVKRTIHPKYFELKAEQERLLSRRIPEGVPCVYSSGAA